MSDDIPNLIKTCCRCKEKKPICEFNKKRKTSYQSHCRACNILITRTYYRQNREDKIKKSNFYALRNPEKVKKWNLEAQKRRNAKATKDMDLPSDYFD